MYSKFILFVLALNPRHKWKTIILPLCQTSRVLVESIVGLLVNVGVTPLGPSDTATVECYTKEAYRNIKLS